MKNQVAGALAALVLSVSMGGVNADEHEHDEEAFEFALIGDVPYRSEDDWKFDNVIEAINDYDDLKWVVHAGDIKTGSSPCSDALFLDRLARFQRFDIPFVYTPGDNEWTDCHRVKAGEYQPLERLARLREIFYPQPGMSLGGEAMAVQTQAHEAGYERYPEHQRWVEHGVMFVTLHVVGSNNGWAAFDPSSSARRGAADDAEVEQRIAATRAWIDESFDLATTQDLRGVMFVFQANPRFEFPRGSVQRRGFDEVLDTLEARSIAFHKPVVLAHGDFHYFVMDKPMAGRDSGRLIENLTRVQTFGSRDVHWLRVRVAPASPEVFSFHQQIVEANRVNHAQP